MDTRRDGSPLLESAVEAYLDKKVRSIGGRTYKFTGRKGTPDRIVVIPFGHIYFVELKQKGKKPEPAQLLWHANALQMGHVVHVIDTREMVDDFIVWAIREAGANLSRTTKSVIDERHALERRYQEDK